MKQNLTHSKRMIVFNLLFLSLLILISFLSYFFLFRKSVRETTIGKVKMLTERSAEETAYNLQKISAMSRLLFLDEDFQNDAEQYAVEPSQEQYERIYRHFSSAFLLENLVKDVAYFPCDGEGQISWSGELAGSIFHNYLDGNLPKIIAGVQDEKNRKGNLFYLPIVYPEGTESPYFALTRNVLSTRQGDYLRRIGVGTMLISKLELKEYFREIDWLEGTGMRLVTASGEIIADSSDDFGAIPDGFLTYDIAIDFLDWRVRCYYDASHLYDSTKPVLIPFLLALAGSAIMLVVMSFLFNFKNTRAMQYLLDTFQNIKSGDIDAKIALTGDAEVNRIAIRFNGMMDAVNELNQRAAEEQQKLLRLQLENSEYELKMLHAQINKHFLFNVLGGIRSLILCGKNEQAEACLMALSDFLRFSLHPQEEVPVSLECRQLEAYLSIQKMRYPKIEVRMEVAESVGAEQIPKLILQPIVENAYAHGLNNQSGRIVVRAWEEGGQIFFAVRDDGRGMDEATLREVQGRIARCEEAAPAWEGHHGLALANIARRLKLCNRENGIEIFSADGAGTEVRVRIVKTAE